MGWPSAARPYRTVATSRLEGDVSHEIPVVVARCRLPERQTSSTSTNNRGYGVGLALGVKVAPASKPSTARFRQSVEDRAVRPLFNYYFP